MYMNQVLNGGRPIEILLVEDSAQESKLTMNALQEGRVSNRVHWVENGEEAMEFLRREGRFADAPRPDLVLLDLKMPRMDGLEVLAEMKGSPNWRRIPVVMMTSETREESVRAAYDQHVNCYVNKPLYADKFKDVVRSIEDFWLGLVRYPAA
jgi:CheY-like chemotaxis protein